MKKETLREVSNKVGEFGDGLNKSNIYELDEKFVGMVKSILSLKDGFSERHLLYCDLPKKLDSLNFQSKRGKEELKFYSTVTWKFLTDKLFLELNDSKDKYFVIELLNQALDHLNESSDYRSKIWKGIDGVKRWMKVEKIKSLVTCDPYSYSSDCIDSVYDKFLSIDPKELTRSKDKAKYYYTLGVLLERKTEASSWRMAFDEGRRSVICDGRKGAKEYYLKSVEMDPSSLPAKLAKENLEKIYQKESDDRKMEESKKKIGCRSWSFHVRVETLSRGPYAYILGRKPRSEFPIDLFRE